MAVTLQSVLVVSHFLFCMRGHVAVCITYGCDSPCHTFAVLHSRRCLHQNEGIMVKFVSVSESNACSSETSENFLKKCVFVFVCQWIFVWRSICVYAFDVYIHVRAGVCIVVVVCTKIKVNNYVKILKFASVF